MLSSDTNKIFDSFCLFVDHIILQKGLAYKNHSSKFYKMQDEQFANYNVYSAPFKQFVYDTSISGANVISQVSGVPSGNAKIDYWNGRVVSTGNYTNVSGSYSVKEFNVYPTEKSDEELLFSTKFKFDTVSTALSGLSANKVAAPCIFINTISFENDAAEFGGPVWTNVNIHCVILADSKYALNNVGNILADQKYKNFCLFNETPFNEFGDLKEKPFNYYDYQQSKSYGFADILEADFYRLNSKEFNEAYPKLRVGFLDFRIETLRDV